MTSTYLEKTDLLYISLDDGPEQLINRKVSEGIVLDIGDDDRIVGIEILDASRRLRLEQVLALEFQKTA